MTGRRPARLLAPLALVVTAVALYLVVTSGEQSAERSEGPVAPAVTASAKEKAVKKKAPERYVVQPGDTPSAIAEKTGVSLQALLDANPNADPNALKPGQKLQLP